MKELKNLSFLTLLTGEQQLRLQKILNSKFKTARLIYRGYEQDFGTISGKKYFDLISKYTYKTEEELFKLIINDKNLYLEQTPSRFPYYGLNSTLVQDINLLKSWTEYKLNNENSKQIVNSIKNLINNNVLDLFCITEHTHSILKNITPTFLNNLYAEVGYHKLIEYFTKDRFKGFKLILTTEEYDKNIKYFQGPHFGYSN